MNGGSATLVKQGRTNYGSGGLIELYIYHKEVYQDIANNYTRVGLGMYVSIQSGYSIGWSDFGKSYLGINGIAQTDFTANVSGKGTIWLASNIEFNVPHNSDGTRWIDVLWKWGVNSSWGQYVYPSGSFGFNLTRIPRTSGVACTDFNIGSTAIINISRNSDSFTHTLIYYFGKEQGTIVEKTSDTTVSWNTSASLFSQIPNDTKGIGTIACQTYSGDTLIGTSVCNFTAYVVDSNPNVEVEIKDVNDITKALTGDKNKLIKYFSNVSINVNATAKNYSSISSYQIKCNDGKVSNSSNCTFNNVESGNFSITVTDSRGLSTTVSVVKDIINYIKLALTEVKCQRESSTSSNLYLSYSGQFYNGSLGNVMNILDIKYRYRIKDGEWSDYVVLEPTIKDNIISQSNLLVGNNFSYHSEYELEIMASDKLIGEDTTKITKEIKLGEGLFEIRKNLFGIHGIFESDTKLLNEVDLNGAVGRTCFSTCLKCNNSPDDIEFGYLLSISRNGTDERDLYNRQVFFAGINNNIYTRVMNNGSWTVWEQI